MVNNDIIELRAITQKIGIEIKEIAREINELEIMISKKKSCLIHCHLSLKCCLNCEGKFE